jgi:23S rRNA pseudouridine1911/1915/1917 synthase
MAAFSRRFHFAVSASEAGKRLDVILSSHLQDCSRSYAAQLIQQGDVQVNQCPCKPSYRVHTGDAIEGTLQEPEAVDIGPEAIDLHILYEDAALLVINKPPGLVVHPAPGHPQGTLVNALLHHCDDLAAFRGEIRPGIVHRLDKDTSGALVVAKTPAVHEHLAGQFKDRSVRKTYLAIVKGEMKSPKGKIALPIGRHPTARKKMSTIAPKSRSAETRYHVRENLWGATLLELDLKTGRTHQIRVHCAAIHHPVLGDDVYGGRHHAAVAPSSDPSALLNLRAKVKRQMLHAWRLGFVHPVDGRWIRCEAEMPEDMQAVLACLRQRPLLQS